MITSPPLARVVVSALSADAATTSRLGWCGARLPEVPAHATVHTVVSDALTAAGIGLDDARVLVIEATADVGAAVARACEALDAADADLVAVVGWEDSPAGEARRVALVALAPWLDDEAEADGPDALALVRSVLAREAAAAEPHDRFPIVAEACARVGISPRSITLCDVHATTAERAARMLAAVEFAVSRGSNAPPHCTIAPMCGPVTPFDAVAALAVHVDALDAHVLPPLPSAVALQPPFAADAAPRPWIDTSPRRAALWTDSASGLSTIVLEEPTRAVPRALPRPVAPWRVDLVLVSAPTRETLAARLLALSATAVAEPHRTIAEIADAFTSPPERFRAAIVTSSLADLAARAQRLAATVAEGAQRLYQTPDGLFFADTDASTGGTAFLFPGQGSQYVGMFRDLCLEVPGVQPWFEGLQDAMLDADPFSPGLLVAPPRQGVSDEQRAALGRAVAGLGCGALLTMTSSLAICERLRAAGVVPDAVAGYSNGENAALTAANPDGRRAVVFAFMRLIRLHDENDAGHVRGISLAVNRARPDAVADAVARESGEVFVALDNCPEQVVLFGEPTAIGRVADRLSAAGAMCLPLSFEHGHHTPLFTGRARQLRALYADVDIRETVVPIYSCATAEPFPQDPEAARDIAAGQWCRPVRFTETIERMYADGIRCFVEVGPGSTLTGFVRSTLRGRPHVVMPSNITGRPDLDQLLHLLGRLFVHGHPVDVTALRRSAPAPQAPRLAARHTRTPLAGPMQHHFALMQEFLDAQLRAFSQVADALGDHPSNIGLADAPFIPPALPTPPDAMLGRVLEHTGERLEAERVLDPATDVFLWHHAIGARLPDRGAPHGGVPVLPFTVSLEIVVEAAARFAGWTGPAITVSDVRATQWIIVDRAPVSLRVVATWQPDRHHRAVRVRLFDTSASARPVFEGIVTDGADACEPLGVAPRGAPTLTPEYFTSMLFHGPLFWSIDRMVAVDDRSICVECTVPDDRGWFANGAPMRDRVSCALLDGASQLVGAWLAENGWRHFGLFPFEWRRFSQFAAPPPAGTRVRLEGRLDAAGPLTMADIDIRALDGTLLARVEGLRGKALAFPAPYYENFFMHTAATRVTRALPDGRCLDPLPAVLFGDRSDIWLRVLARQVLNDAELESWNTLAAPERTNWLRVRLVAKEVALDHWARVHALSLRGRDVDAAPLTRGFAVSAPDGSTVVVSVHDTGTTCEGRLRTGEL